ncbi:FkbM family methyltransferase [Sinorhizobium meliloti]|uniref:FkbM family methyltransferase n=1 Tax=Rhizobium meliloti TaxID=382 RepID=UPI000FD8D941|nr:FkbM family methyltransferase [Sinorhizobium meliloti]RVH21425.1 FkbM family methyltransferase [Sinorhizobium meliloti]RVH21486.1 FkbM family methyltransferase [Sinorhizobium meliloti]
MTGIIARLARTAGLATRADLVAMHELHMLSSSHFYTLWGDNHQRKGSNKALVELFFGLVRITQPELFIEAGAKMGDTSIRARGVLPEARIVAFEASPENYELYSKTQPHAENRVEYVHYALSDREGTIDFNIVVSSKGEAAPKNSGANSILPRSDKSTEYKTVAVPTKRVDDFFPGIKSCAMWVDVEGASKQVLSGSAETLSKCKVAIVEVEDYQKWAGQWRAANVIETMMNAGLVPVARDFEFKGQYNIVFLRSDVFGESRDIRQNIEFYYSTLVKR